MPQTLAQNLLAHTPLLTAGVLLSVALLAAFVAVTLRERHAIVTTSFTLTSIMLAYFLQGTAPASVELVGRRELLCLQLIFIFVLQLAHSLQPHDKWTTVQAFAIRVLQLLLAGFALVVAVMPLALTTPWILAALWLGIVAVSLATGLAATRGLRGQQEAFYQVVAWLGIVLALLYCLRSASEFFTVVLLWSLATAAVFLTLSFAHQALRSRMYWSMKLQESELNGRLLGIERSHRDFSREVEQHLGALEDGAYEEAILTSLLGHLDGLIPVVASAVVLSRNHDVRLVTRFEGGEREEFESILRTREPLLQSVCHSEKAAVIHSDQLGLRGFDAEIATLCIIPIRVEHADWACVLFAREPDEGLQREELLLVQDFAIQARNALISAEKFDRVRRQAETDALTGLLNRGAILQRAERAFRKAQSLDTNLSLFFIDIDKFKAVNDTYGHEAGDIVLRTVAQLCHDCLRENDLVGRYGGEEFVALLPGADAENAERIAERIRATVHSTRVQAAAQVIRVTVSIGIAEITDGSSDVSSLIGAADRALYCAKRDGRNRVVHHLYVVRGDKTHVGS